MVESPLMIIEKIWTQMFSGPQQTIEHNHRNGKILVQQSIVLYDCFYIFVCIVTLR